MVRQSQASPYPSSVVPQVVTETKLRRARPLEHQSGRSWTVTALSRVSLTSIPGSCDKAKCESERKTMPLRTIIVDDEQIARDVLREELEQIQGLVIIGEADDGRSALHIIDETSPDLVFLDLQLPDLGGFEV